MAPFLLRCPSIVSILARCFLDHSKSILAGMGGTDNALELAGAILWLHHLFLTWVNDLPKWLDCGIKNGRIAFPFDGEGNTT